MDNQSHNSLVFNVSGCLKEWIIREYLAGNLPADIVRQVETHLADCPLCSDAVEGYMEMQPGTDINAILDKARTGIFSPGKEPRKLAVIKNPEPGKHKRSRILYIGIAASLALLIGSYFVISMLINNEVPKTEVADLEEMKKTPSPDQGVVAGSQPAEDALPPMKTGEGDETTSVISGAAGLQAQEKALSYDADEEIHNAVTVTDYKAIGQTIITDMTLSENQDGAGKDKSLSGGENKLGIGLTDDEAEAENQKEVLSEITVSGKKQAKKAAATEVSKNKKTDQTPVAGMLTRTEASGTKPAGATEAATGIQAYETGDYARAIDGLEVVLEDNPNNDQALYYTGMSYYHSQQKEKALKNLEKVSKNKNSSFYQAAKWQVAVIYRELNQKSRAIKVLNEIIDENGTYRQNAVDAVEDLNK